MAANTPERNFPVLRVADEPGTDDPTKVRKRMLKQLAERLDQHHAFAKGQFVAWKPGLKNKTSPDYGEPAIVTAVLPTLCSIEARLPQEAPISRSRCRSSSAFIARTIFSSSASMAAASSRSKGERLPSPLAQGCPGKFEG